jgi:hypothetical protein
MISSWPMNIRSKTADDQSWIRDLLTGRAGRRWGRLGDLPNLGKGA